MHSLNRFLSASAASWSRILFTIATQVLLVPVFLGHWTVEEYGSWLIIQTLVAVTQLLSTGHQTFVGYEFLKIGDSQQKQIRSLFYSALPYVLIIAVLELSGLLVLIELGFIATSFDPNHSIDRSILHQAIWSLVLYSLYWLFASGGALASRAVAPYGHFARMAWWTTFVAVAQAVVSGAAVAEGADLLQTVVSVLLAGIIANIPFFIDVWRLFRRYGISPVQPDWRFGLHNVGYSLAISLSSVLDLSRQQGVRVFLGAIIGVAEMTAFSTTRTLSNLSLQGIGTVTNPIMPELMRFLRARDTDRTNATVGFVWFFIVILLAPILIIFQCVMPTIFHIWTRGKIEFDPLLFGLFSISLLVFSIARPAVAVLQGNNLLKVQLWISIAVTAIAVGGILLLTSTFGVSGAAASLLLAELVGTTLAIRFACMWLSENHMVFPWRLFAVTLCPILVAATAILALIYLPKAIVPIAVLSVTLCLISALAFVRQLPPVAARRVRSFIIRSSFVGRG